MKKLVKSVIALSLAAAILMCCCGVRLSGNTGLVLLSNNVAVGDENSNNSNTGAAVPSDDWSTAGADTESTGNSNVTGTPVPTEAAAEPTEVPAAPEATTSLPAVSEGMTPFSQIQYIRPDTAHMRQLADTVCSMAKGSDVTAIFDAYDEFSQAFKWFLTAYYLSDIHYSADLYDSYWEAEYNFCQSAYKDVSMMRNDIFTAMAASPCRRQLEQAYGSLEDYDGENVWDDEMTNLMKQESDLTNQYYSQCGDPNATIDDMAQTLVDLIRVRNRLAAHAGYDSYEAFANFYYFYRDFTPEQMSAYLEAIRVEMVPLYRAIWDYTPELEDADETSSMDYVRTTAQGMGGKIWEAFQLMENAGLYDITYSDSKYISSFEVYLEAYNEPFVFMNPGLNTYDHLTLAHEFGHFCNDYVSEGEQISIDVCEIFSQGMEYLALFEHPEQNDLARYKMADSLATYVEQACWAKFEHEMYLIPDSELNTQALYDLYSKTAGEYGFDALGFSEYDFVDVNHFYTSPMYIISYIVSNDAAMQILLMERSQPGSGLDCYMKNLSNTEPYFMAFLQSAGLKSPFDTEHLAQMRQMIQDYYPETVVGSAASQDDGSGSNSNNSTGYTPAASGSAVAA